MFKASLVDYKLVFTGISKEWGGGVATIAPSNGNQVVGAIYDISEEDLYSLDDYEGYNKIPKVYNRKYFIVTGENGKTFEAISYFKIGKLIETLPSNEYIAVIKEGYRDWDIQVSNTTT